MSSLHALEPLLARRCLPRDCVQQSYCGSVKMADVCWSAKHIYLGLSNVVGHWMSAFWLKYIYLSCVNERIYIFAQMTVKHPFGSTTASAVHQLFT